MVDAGERSSDEGEQEKGNRVKNVNTLRAQQAIARFGPTAKYPLCLAALEVWRLDAQLHKFKSDAVTCERLLNRLEQEKKKTRAWLDQSYKERKEKEAIEADAYWHKFNDLVPRIQKAHQAVILGVALYEEMFLYAAGKFGRELLAAERTKNTSALRALSRVQKRWKALSNGGRLKYGELRELGMLELLGGKKIRAEGAKGVAVAGYMEAASGGNRPLSDDEWQRRLTAREIHSHLEVTGGSRLAGDGDAKQIRRVAKRLGLQLAEDQRGRKWKEPAPTAVKQEPKKRRGRPPTGASVKPVFVKNPEQVEGALLKQPRVVKADSWVKTEKETAGIKGVETKKVVATIDYADVQSARKEIAAIDRAINELRMARGGRLGKFVY
jgi:hypothetical protein